MPELKKSGFSKYWPMKEFQGKDAHGKPVGKEVYRDMETGQVYNRKWDAGMEKTPEMKGNKAYSSVRFGNSQAYKDGWERIWGKKKGTLRWPMKERFVQIRNPKTGNYTKIDRKVGQIIEYSSKPFNRIPIIKREVKQNTVPPDNNII